MLEHSLRLPVGRDIWAQLLRTMSRQASPPAGPVLDLGCGRGEFVLAGLGQGHEVYGIDTDGARVGEYRAYVRDHHLPDHYPDRCLAYDGTHLPFASGTFAVVHSWYAVEHMASLGEVLREAVRVTKPGGYVIIAAQDARSFYDGHIKAPILPFLPRHLLVDWCTVFDCEPGMADYLAQHCFYVTTPQVAAILHACGCEIVEEAGDPPVMPFHVDLDSRESLLRVAREVKRVWEAGKWPQPVDTWVVARRR